MRATFETKKDLAAFVKLAKYNNVIIKEYVKESDKQYLITFIVEDTQYE